MPRENSQLQHVRRIDKKDTAYVYERQLPRVNAMGYLLSLFGYNTINHKSGMKQDARNIMYIFNSFQIVST